MMTLDQDVQGNLPRRLLGEGGLWFPRPPTLFKGNKMGVFDLLKTGTLVLDMYVSVPDSGTLKIPGGSHCHSCKKLLPEIKTGDEIALVIEKNTVLGRLCSLCRDAN